MMILIKVNRGVNVNRWINIKDESPIEMQAVIAMDEFDAMCDPYVSIDGVQGAIYSKGAFYLDHPTTDHPCIACGVTHWMPLPPKPSN